MRKTDVLRFKPGDRILWSNSASIADSYRERSFCSGTVLDVTPRGGVRVKEMDAQPWHGDREDGPEYWVPYHHIMCRKWRRRE